MLILKKIGQVKAKNRLFQGRLDSFSNEIKYKWHNNIISPNGDGGAYMIQKMK